MKDKRKDHDAVDKPLSEKQFCKWIVTTYVVFKKSGAIALVLLGLMAGRLAGRRNCAKFKIVYWRKYSTFTVFDKGAALL